MFWETTSSTALTEAKRKKWLVLLEKKERKSGRVQSKGCAEDDQHNRQIVSLLALLLFTSGPGLLVLLVTDYFWVLISPRYPAPSSFGSLCLQWRIIDEMHSIRLLELQH